MKLIKFMFFVFVFVCSVPVTASARTCGDFKGVALARVQEKMQTICREVTGKNITSAKKSQILKMLDGSWESNYTFQCMQSCGSSTSCVDNMIDDFVRSALNEITPGITKAWCTN